MNKSERIFYFVIIIVEFALLLLFYIRLNDCRKNQRVNFRDFDSSRKNSRLYSFYGDSSDGQKQLVHFTAYSKYHYILVTYSSQCKHCDLMLEDAGTFYVDKEIDKDVKLLLITSDPLEKMNVGRHFRCLKISHDDFIQFGFETPSIFAVNGKGDILYKQSGYSSGTFEKILKQIEENKIRRSKSIN